MRDTQDRAPSRELSRRRLQVVQPEVIGMLAKIAGCLANYLACINDIAITLPTEGAKG